MISPGDTVVVVCGDMAGQVLKTVSLVPGPVNPMTGAAYGPTWECEPQLYQQGCRLYWGEEVLRLASEDEKTRFNFRVVQ